MTPSVMAGVVLLARTGEGEKAGPIGLAVILVLCVACYFLFKSMSKHLRRVREDFPVDASPAEPAPQPAQVSLRKPDPAPGPPPQS